MWKVKNTEGCHFEKNQEPTSYVNFCSLMALILTKIGEKPVHFCCTLAIN